MSIEKATQRFARRVAFFSGYASLNSIKESTAPQACYFMVSTLLDSSPNWLTTRTHTLRPGSKGMGSLRYS